MAKVRILGVTVGDLDKEGLQKAIVTCVEANRKEVYAYANIHALNIARHNSKFKNALNQAHVVYCDGEGVRLGARILGTELPPRTALTRWIWDLGALFEDRGFSVYILGGKDEKAEAASRRLLVRHPKLRIVGSHHGYFEKNGEESSAVVESINLVKPNVLFVGFGMPDQELWIQRNLARLEVNAIMPCGGMIDYLSGEVRAAPKWMIAGGLEWMHRLYQDPARLWRRYLWGNPIFFFRIFLQLLTEGRNHA